MGKNQEAIVSLACQHCGEAFSMKASRYVESVKRGRAKYCSIKCVGLALRREVTVECLNCRSNFSKKQHDAARSPNHFCSKSCAATYNNTKQPKRKAQERVNNPKSCRKCGQEFTPTGRGRALTCGTCNSNKVDWSTITLGDCKERRGKQFRSRIGSLARDVYFAIDKPRVCYNCGYGKHVEVHHKRQLHQFSDETPISVINHPDNLVALCPTCHWEADTGVLTF